MSTLNLVKSQKTFGGMTNVYEHESSSTGTKMTVSIFLPPQVADETKKAPVLYWLSGLTCTHLNFIEKAGAQRVAAECGVILVCPDTSPRGTDIPGEHDSWDFGSGAGFYVDATSEAFSKNYNMYTYVTSELPEILRQSLPVADTSCASIFGHSMGGHGALTLGLRNPGMYRSVSAFAPICNPCECPWGVKAFTGYFGADNKSNWYAHDASMLVKAFKSTTGNPLKILCDQGTNDSFLKDGQLLPDALVSGSAENPDVDLNMRMQSGYDHSYFFIASFVEDHIRFHAKELGL